MAATAILFGIQQGAEQLGGISPWTLRKHIAQGHIRVTRIGRRILLGADELERIRRKGLPSLGTASLMRQHPAGNGCPNFWGSLELMIKGSKVINIRKTETTQIISFWRTKCPTI